jgi:O-antigen ligase
VPFALPVLCVGVGSLLALSNAAAPLTALLAMLQDLYLYLWFVMVVNLWAGRGNLLAFRIGWVVVADAVALGSVAVAMAVGAWSPAHALSARGLRWSATFYNPNMFADYLVSGVFVLLSLERRLSRTAFAGSLLLLALGLLLTKSNGGLVALAVGLAAWGVARTAATGVRPARVVGGVSFALGVLLALAWSQQTWRWADPVLGRLAHDTFAGRAARSSEGRERIWAQLEESVQRYPLGLGPANSAEQSVEIGERERPGSLRSKEAHSDYVAAWVERGLLGFVGVVLGVVESLRRVRDGWRGAAGTRVTGRIVLAAMLGGLVASAVHSAVIEKLHFRHFWLFLALATAACAGERE